MRFKLVSDYAPAGDQPRAIGLLCDGINGAFTEQTLLGVTGSGKTFTIANLINKVNLPTLVLAHNKTLAAQLATELRNFFPNNAVEYFVSYYDYYQPEAYLPGTDTYIEKETDINEEVERLRHRATSALLERKDVIIVATVSAIYGLGSPNEYREQILSLNIGQQYPRRELIARLVHMQYARNQSLKVGTFDIKGSTLDLVPTHKEQIYRLIFSGEVLNHILIQDLVSREVIDEPKQLFIFPAKHFVVSSATLNNALENIEQELASRVKELQGANKLLEADRLQRRTTYDLTMIREVGYCNGIENYSRHLTGRKPGEPSYTLLNYFPDQFLTVIDESHVTIPQLGGMYAGDLSRKTTLVEHGFRLPSALDNRPLKFDEFEQKTPLRIYMSATPGNYEKARSAQIVEQVIRPTGLVDPATQIKPITNQVDDAIEQIKVETAAGHKALVTTITKKMAEDLSEYLKNNNIKAGFLHSEVDTLDRIRIIESLKNGRIDVLVGVNLLREGIDLPEVSLVLILDADKEGFLRSETSLIQTIGRAARNVRGRVILYADNITGSIKRALDETKRRRNLQIAHNAKHGITPTTIKKKRQKAIVEDDTVLDNFKNENLDYSQLPEILNQKQKQMKDLARSLNFEQAALIRDEIGKLREILKDNTINGQI